MVFSTTFTDKGLKLVLDEVFNLGWEDEGWQFTDFYDVADMEDGYMEDAIIQYPDEVDIVSEGGSYTRVDISQIANARYNTITLKTELPITQEAEEDLKYEKMKDGAKAMAGAMHRKIERLATQNLYNGFTTVLSPRDGLSIFNASHTVNQPIAPHPTTWSNAGTGKLNALNLKAARITGRKQIDDHGSPVPAVFNQLIVCPDLEYIAEELAESMLDPDTNNNRKNVAMRGIKFVVADYLQEAAANSSTMWFLRDMKRAKNKFKWRIQPESEIVREEKTGNKLYRQRARISFGWSDDHGVYGSNGTV
jgi:hypothetical protein